MGFILLLGNEPCFFPDVGFIVIDDARALPIPMPDVLKPLPKKAEREERGLSAGSTPVPPPKVCYN